MKEFSESPRIWMEGEENQPEMLRILGDIEETCETNVYWCQGFHASEWIPEFGSDFESDCVSDRYQYEFTPERMLQLNAGSPLTPQEKTIYQEYVEVRNVSAAEGGNSISILVNKDRSVWWVGYGDTYLHCPLRLAGPFANESEASEAAGQIARIVGWRFIQSTDPDFPTPSDLQLP